MSDSPCVCLKFKPVIVTKREQKMDRTIENRRCKIFFTSSGREKKYEKNDDRVADHFKIFRSKINPNKLTRLTFDKTALNK